MHIFVFVIDFFFFSLRWRQIMLCHMQGFDNDAIKTHTHTMAEIETEKERKRKNHFYPWNFLTKTTQSKQNNSKMISIFQSELESINEQHLEMVDAFEIWKRNIGCGMERARRSNDSINLTYNRNLYMKKDHRHCVDCYKKN